MGIEEAEEVAAEVEEVEADMAEMKIRIDQAGRGGTTATIDSRNASEAADEADVWKPFW